MLSFLLFLLSLSLSASFLSQTLGSFRVGRQAGSFSLLPLSAFSSSWLSSLSLYIGRTTLLAVRLPSFGRFTAVLVGILHVASLLIDWE